MANASATQGVVFENGTATLMARITGDADAAITQADISSVAYTLYLLDADYPDNPDTRTAITGHSAAAVAVSACVYDSLQTGSPWSKDSTGYNFKHTIDVSTNAAFTLAGRQYLVCWSLTPESGQVIRHDFLLSCI